MGKILEKLYEKSPHFIQNLFVTGFNLLQYRKRYRQDYHKSKAYFYKHQYDSKEQITELQEKRLQELLSFVTKNSPYYRNKFAGIDFSDFTLSQLSTLPVTTKEEIRANLKDIYTLPASKAYVSKTGGTTGKSLEVRFFWSDMQERMAMLDYFRERFGFKHSSRTAWFSGKALLSERDLAKNRYWKTDFIHNIRYYSTFHISPKSAQHYIDDLNRFQPAFIVGFPSSIVEIARTGQLLNRPLSYRVKAIFPTAETLVPEEVKILEAFFGCGVYNQYASSEGAPFITECEYRNLHFETLSGVIEVVDDSGHPAQEGRILVTAFATRGTPLIRYDIGDVVKWSSEKECPCGRAFPLIESVQGRVNDYIFSRETGKINLGNISNCVKYVKGIVKFQIIQNSLDAVTVKIVRAPEFTDRDERIFKKELRARLGDQMEINIEYVADITKEKSGKYRIVKNNIKDRIN